MAEREGEVRWDGLRSRDAGARDSALENIRQAVLKQSEAVVVQGKAPPAAEGLLPSAGGAPGGFNEMLARLLMLSKRCPFRDVREKSEAILRSVQVLLDVNLGNYVPIDDILKVLQYPRSSL